MRESIYSSLKQLYGETVHDHVRQQLSKINECGSSYYFPSKDMEVSVKNGFSFVISRFFPTNLDVKDTHQCS